MPTTRFNTCEMTHFQKQALKYAEPAHTWRDWCPVERIPFTRIASWKVMERVRDAHASLDGARTNRAETSYTWGSAQVVHFAHELQWTELEVQLTRQNGGSLRTDEIALSIDKINRQIERLVLQGSMPWEPDVTGIIAGSTDVGATTALDAVLFDAAGSPRTHAAAAADILFGLGYDPPFTWLLGQNLRSGMANVQNAAASVFARDLVERSFDMEVHYATINPTAAAVPTKDDLQIYSFEAALADDSCWVMFPTMDVNNFSVLEVRPITVTIEPEMDIRTRTFYGRVDWAGTVKVAKANAVVDEHDVDRV